MGFLNKGGGDVDSSAHTQHGFIYISPSANFYYSELNSCFPIFPFEKLESTLRRELLVKQSWEAVSLNKAEQVSLVQCVLQAGQNMSRVTERFDFRYCFHGASFCQH